MTQNDTVDSAIAQSITAAYGCPRLTILGYAHDVILRVAGGGDDFFGYSRPEFEFVVDGDRPAEV